MKRLTILGSTGSIGRSTLEVVEALDDGVRVVALAAGRRVDRLAEQVRRHRPRVVSVADAETAAALAAEVGGSCEIVHGEDGLRTVATIDGADLVVSAVVGAAGMRPTLAALERGTDVALANKEALVVAGRHMTEAARRSGARILPVDSEHNALHQCLRGERADEVARIWLTASGGPFRGRDAAALADVTAEQALAHPTWEMGPKITIDSATLMNKGLEVIEARWLFDMEPERIRVVVHPQSVVHSMVEFVDGSFKAQLGVTDMRHPIAYALTWPERTSIALPQFDPTRLGRLDFEPADTAAFPCLALAYEALRRGGAAAAVLNAANEVAVEAFLAGRIGFPDIARIDEGALDEVSGASDATIDDLVAADAEARAFARRAVERGVCT